MDSKSQYEAYYSEITGINDEIGKPGLGIEDVHQIKRTCIKLQARLQSDLHKFTKYEVRRFNEKLNGIFVAVSRKETELGRRVFKFKGDPIPREDLGSKQSASETLQDAVTAGIGAKIPEVSGLSGVKYTVRELNSFIRDVEGSIITTSSAAAGQIHVSRGRRSVLWLKSSGSVYIEDVCDSILVVDCHQLRLKRVAQSKIYGRVENNTFVIEECADLEVVQGSEDSITVDDFSDPTRRPPQGVEDIGSGGSKNIKVTTGGTTREFAWVQQIPDGNLQDSEIDGLRTLLGNI